jgi:hypothetical protein
MADCVWIRTHPYAIGHLVLRQPQAVVAFIHNHVFGADALFIRTKNMVGARCAQSLA